MNLLNWLTLASYVALNVDLVLQIRRIYKTKSSNDLSIIGIAIRYIVTFVVLAKFISLSDQLLIVSQGTIVLSFTAYFVLAVYYMKHRKKYSKSKSGRGSRRS